MVRIGLLDRAARVLHQSEGLGEVAAGQIAVDEGGWLPKAVAKMLSRADVGKARC